MQVFPLNLIQKVDFQCRKEWKNGEEAAKVDGNQKTEARLLGAAEKSDPAGKCTKIEPADCEHGVREYLKGTNPKERGGN